MRAQAALGAALTACGLLLAACGDGSASPDPAPAAPPAAVTGEGLELSVTAASGRVVLGDEIVFRVKIENVGEETVDVAVPRIDRSVLSFRVRREHGDPAVVERLYAKLGPTGQLEWLPANAATLAPGDSVSQEVAVAAVQTGKQVFVPQYARAGHATLTGGPVEVEVVPDGERDLLGARMETNLGTLVVKLRPDLAYNTVESFASLTRRGFFDGLTFHRIVAGFMAQGGDPKGDGSGGPGYFLPREMHRKLLHDRGVLSMARTNDPDTSGSQFFLLFARREMLDPKPPRSPGYITFGELVDGEETLAALEAVECVWPARVQAALDAGRVTERQLEQMASRGQVEKSQPKERVEIRSVKLLTLQ